MKNRVSLIALCSLLSGVACVGEVGETDPEVLDEVEQDIIGGGNASSKVAPASVALFDSNDDQNCGGTLIARNWVLTAAHCLWDRSGATPVRHEPKAVLIGAKDLNANDVPTDAIELIDVKRVIEHSGYDPKQSHFHDDIALLELVYSTKHAPARLLTHLDKQPASGDLMTAVGWGRTDRLATVPATKQQTIKLPFIDSATCKATWPSLNAGQMCAGAELDRDTCPGDSGGPLYTNRNGDWRVAGIVSYGATNGAIKCGVTEPGVYTNVASYIDWINKHTVDSKTPLWTWPVNNAWPPLADGSNRNAALTEVSSLANYQALPGDFNGDGKADVFYYQPGPGQDYLYLTGALVPKKYVVDTDYEPIVGDFNADGWTDILWYAPGAAQHKIWWFQGQGEILTLNAQGAVPVVAQATRFTRPFVAKLDNNASADIYWYDPSTLVADEIWYSNGRGAGPTFPYLFTKKAKNGPSEVLADGTTFSSYTPLAGDFNADGLGDIFWYANDTVNVRRKDFIWRGKPVQADFTATSSVGDQVKNVFKPFAGDFDGNGATDIYWYNPDFDMWDGVWWFKGGANGVPQHVQGDEETSFAASPIVGDFSGTPSGQKKTDDIFWHFGGRAYGEKW